MSKSKLVSPKAWYLVAAGAVALAADGTRRIIKRRRQARQGGEAGYRAAEVPVEVVEAAAPKAKTKAPTPAKATPAAKTTGDDLTAIKGIGPVFARRLAEAGYTTYAEVAMATPEALREAAQATASADPAAWIAAAKARL